MKSVINQKIITKIKELRIDSGMSQLDLAVALNVSKGFIGNVESSKYTAHYSMDQILALAKIFRCTTHDIVPKMS